MLTQRLPSALTVETTGASDLISWVEIWEAASAINGWYLPYPQSRSYVHFWGKMRTFFVQNAFPR